MKLSKKIALVLSAVILCSSVNIPASAKEISAIVEDEVSPAYEYAFDVSNNLVISSGTAKCSSRCVGTSDVVSVTIEQTLQKFWGLWIWNDVDNASWTKTSNGTSTSVEGSKSGLASGKYRLKSVFTLTSSSGKTETITVYSTEKSI